MDISTWMPLYDEILEDFGYSRSEDEASARLLKALMQNADLIDDSEIEIAGTPVIIGPANPSLEGLKDRQVVSAGSATSVLMEKGLIPDIVVTDLDGDIECQIEASEKGAITFIHAHGDNTDLIMDNAKRFTGPVVLTTQSTPDNVIRNYGGFTDGDRAVCIMLELGAQKVELRGFDFSTPVIKDGSDPGIKAHKLQWAKRIISMFGDRVIL